MSLNFVVDVALLFGLGFFIYRIVAFRRNGHKILGKYKPGTTEYDAYRRGLSPLWLVGSVFLTSLVAVKSAFDMRSLFNTYDDAFGLVLLIVIFILSIALVTIFVMMKLRQKLK